MNLVIPETLNPSACRCIGEVKKGRVGIQIFVYLEGDDTYTMIALRRDRTWAYTMPSIPVEDLATARRTIEQVIDEEL